MRFSSTIHKDEEPLIFADHMFDGDLAHRGVGAITCWGPD